MTSMLQTASRANSWLVAVTLAPVAAAACFASSCARSNERFVSSTEPSPTAFASANADARPAPPAPSNSTRLPVSVGRNGADCPGSVRSMLATSPSASVLKPMSLPSSVCMNVLTAPISRAMGSISSSNGMMASLCGTVTLEPMKPGYARAASTNPARFSGAHVERHVHSVEPDVAEGRVPHRGAARVPGRRLAHRAGEQRPLRHLRGQRVIEIALQVVERAHA